MADSTTVVAMRLFANWEMDRTSASAVQRVFSVSINRLLLNYNPCQSIVLTMKLQGLKRSLRSNEIPVTVRNAAVDLDVDISFTIQYPHFLKRKHNILQILVQRKRKYKNRPIPGGFKTLAAGAINLTELLQRGGIREVLLFNTDEREKTLEVDHPLGRLMLTSCQTSPSDMESHLKKTGPDGDISEDDSDSEFDEPIDTELAEASGDGAVMGVPRHQARTINMKQVRRKNLKQKLGNLLKRFKVPEDETLLAESVPSISGAPTAKELEALFEELDNLSDSGHEMAPDEISIGSNPRPVLRPFFTRSREVLPAIYDAEQYAVSESDDDADMSSDDRDKEKAGSDELVALTAHQAHGQSNQSHVSQPISCSTVQTQQRVGSTISAPLIGFQGSLVLPHSQTTGSISRGGGGAVVNKDSARNNSIVIAANDRGSDISDQLSRLLTSSSSSVGINDGSVHDDSSVTVWLCSPDTAPLLSPSLPTAICCSTAAHVKQAMTLIITRIHKFCISNSADPSTSLIGVIGSDRFVGYVLRAYVDCLHHKSTSNWLQHLRFVFLPPSTSLTGRLIVGLDQQCDLLMHDIWDRVGDVPSADSSAASSSSLGSRLTAWASQAGSVHNLPIGEALLQMSGTIEGESGSVFVPFLSEVRVGQTDDEALAGSTSSYGVSSVLMDGTSPRGGVVNESAAAKEGGTAAVGGSPPCSPHSRSDTREMTVEYWQDNTSATSLPPSSTAAPNSSKKDKGSMKSAFRSIMISRTSSNQLLTLTFVKEKKKDKMLQKLGMKKGQKSELDTAPVQVGNVARLLCSGSGKHSELSVSVDGCWYHGVRYFQTSSQWQTHLKSIPLAIHSGSSSLA